MGANSSGHSLSNIKQVGNPATPKVTPAEIRFYPFSLFFLPQRHKDTKKHKELSFFSFVSKLKTRNRLGLPPKTQKGKTKNPFLCVFVVKSFL